MKIFGWNQILELENEIRLSEKKSALTIGGFDGPHVGHKSLFDSVLKHQELNHIVVTFNFTELYKQFKKDFPGKLSTSELKVKVFENLGFDYCLMIDFSKDFSKIKGYDFLNILRKSCSMQCLVIGSDFRCGYNLDTGVAEISDYSKQFGLELTVCEPVLFENKRISSTMLRNAIIQGDFAFANKLLLVPYTIDVSKFEWFSDCQKSSSVNRKLISANRSGYQVFPKSGVYDVKVDCADGAFNSKLYVESIFLRLEVPLEQNLSNISKLTVI